MAEGLRICNTEPLDRWALGDLAIALVPPASTKEESGANQNALRDFAVDIDVNFNLLKDAYYTAKSWPPNLRYADVGFSTHSRYRDRDFWGDDLDALMRDTGAYPRSVLEDVIRAERRISDKAVRLAIIERSKTRRTNLLTVARTLEEEEISRSRAEAKAERDLLHAQRMRAEVMRDVPMQTVRFNERLNAIVSELVDLREWTMNIPPVLLRQSRDNANHVKTAIEKILDHLAAPTAAPPPPPLHRRANVIDVG